MVPLATSGPSGTSMGHVSGSPGHGSKVLSVEEQVPEDDLRGGSGTNSGKRERKQCKNDESKKVSGKRRRALKCKENSKSKDICDDKHPGSKTDTLDERIKNQTVGVSEAITTHGKEKMAKKREGTLKNGNVPDPCIAEDGFVSRRIDKLLAKARRALEKRQSPEGKEPDQSKANHQERKVSLRHSPTEVAPACRRKNLVKQRSHEVLEAWASPVPCADRQTDARDRLFRRRSLDSLNDSRCSGRSFVCLER